MGTPTTRGAGTTPPAHPPSCYGGEAEAIQKIADLTIQGVKPEIVLIETDGLGAGLPGKVPVLLRPGENGGTLAPIKGFIEEYRERPARRTGTASVTTLASFVALVNRHKDGHSAIFAKTDWPKPALTAVIDYHEGDEAHAARNLGHRVHYGFPVTPEFQAWIDNVGQKFSQIDFAAFLEDHAAELASPDAGEVVEYERLFKAKFATPNELIDLARSLEVSVGQVFKQAIRLSSGEAEMTFKEEHSNAIGEKITIPGIFMISLRAFVDGAKVRIPARLRYRAVSGGGVIWFYDMYRWEDALRERVFEDMTSAGKDTSLPTYEGAPEAAR